MPIIHAMDEHAGAATLRPVTGSRASGPRRRVSRPSVREGYDLWSAAYDDTPNPLIALDRRYSVKLLAPRSRERILDAGCGTGANLRMLVRAKSRPLGLDFSSGMLRVARHRNPGVPLAQADLSHDLPLRRESFDGFLCALVSEHLTNLRTLFREAFAVLKRGGRLVFSAFHPELAAAGIEANFESGGIEYRLGAERYTVADYLDHIKGAGFQELQTEEHCGDTRLVQEVALARKYLDQPLLLTVAAIKP